MLASKNRLPASEIEKVKANGKLYQKKFFGISIAPGSDPHNSRFGFIVSTKISKLAVQRNRIKRALSESVRYHLFAITPGYDIIFLAKKVLVTVSTNEIMQEVQIALRDLKMAK